MGQALGLSKRGDRLIVFASSKTMDDYIGRDLREKLDNPLVFQRKPAAAENSVGDKAHGVGTWTRGIVPSADLLAVLSTAHFAREVIA